MPSVPRRILGVDFSGARNAGKGISIAAGSARGGTLVIEGLVAARDLPGGSRERGAALTALREELVREPAVAALDFPFALPDEVARGLMDLKADPVWREVARGIAAFGSADAFRAECRRVSPREIRRTTDRETGTPWCAWNLRLYRQTYHGIADVLLPLAEEGRACVLPMEDPVAGASRLLESCPASMWRGFAGLDVRGYKDRTRGGAGAAQHARRAILSRLEEEGLTIPEPLRGRAMADRGGDAVDALSCALAAHRAARGDTAALRPARDVDLIEGRVFV